MGVRMTGSGENEGKECDGDCGDSDEDESDESPKEREEVGEGGEGVEEVAVVDEKIQAEDDSQRNEEMLEEDEDGESYRQKKILTLESHNEMRLLVQGNLPFLQSLDTELGSRVALSCTENGCCRLGPDQHWRWLKNRLRGKGSERSNESQQKLRRVLTKGQ
jgi:G3E family GTPase